jgi:PAS domain S-box-containing protein
MDRFETAKMIRSRPRNHHTPIPFLSKYKSDAPLLRGYDLGAVDFLFTPIVRQVLRSKVAAFVELSRNAALLRAQAQALGEHVAVLQKAKQKFRSLLEAAPDALIMCREDGEIVLVNSRVESVFGYERDDDEIVGKQIQLLVSDWSYQIPPLQDEALELSPRCGSERVHCGATERRLVSRRNHDQSAASGSGRESELLALARSGDRPLPKQRMGSECR